MRSRVTAVTATLLLTVALLVPGLVASQPALAIGWSQSAQHGIEGTYNTPQKAQPAMAVFSGALYAGTSGGARGCQIWRWDGTNPWTQVNIDGFGDATNAKANSMAVVGSYLYVATQHSGSIGCEVWKYNGSAWTQVNTDGFGSSDNWGAVLKWDGTNLYAGISNSSGCTVRRYSGSGTSWDLVSSVGFGVANNVAVYCMELLGGYLHVGTYHYGGCQVWRYSGSGTTWTQVNTDGFGDPENAWVSSMAYYGGYLFVGTYRGAGCQVWRTASTVTLPYTDWTKVNTNGFGDTKNFAATSMTASGSYLYVGTDNSADGYTGTEVWRTQGAGGPPFTDWFQVNVDGFGDAKTGTTTALIEFNSNLYSYISAFTDRFCEVRRYDSGTTWTMVAYPGFAKNNNRTVTSMATSGADLYAGTFSSVGCEVWRYNGSSWAPLVGTTGTTASGFGDYNNNDIGSMQQCNGYLYVGTTNSATGAEVWRWDGVNPWAQVNTNGFGDAHNTYAPSMASQGTTLYVGTGRDNSTGCEVWAYSGSWSQVNTDGFGSASNRSVDSLLVFGGSLYAGASNYADGCKVWRYGGSGTTWAQVNANGFGDANNNSVSSMAEYGSQLYAGTSTPATGCQVWQTTNGTSWTRVADDGFWTHTSFVENGVASSMSVGPDSLLYVGSESTSGCTVWRYNGSYWTQVNTEGFGDANNDSTASLCLYGSNLFAGTANDTSGCEVWRTTSTTQAPHIDTLNPNHGGVGDTVDISGSGLGVPRDSSYVTFNGVHVTEYSVWLDGHLSCKVPAGASTGPVVVHNAGGASNGLTFTMPNQPPRVTGMTPATGPPGTEVTITGSNFGSARGASYIQIGNTVRATEYASWGGTRVKFLIPEMGFGDFRVYLVTPYGTAYAGILSVRHSVWYLAEGSTTWGFDTYFTIENPNNYTVNADITYMTTGSPVSGGTVTMPATSQATVFPDQVVGHQDFSTRVVCREGQSISVDRTMSWTGQGAASPGAHSSIGVTRPANTWYLPEGSSAWGFETWLLIQNPTTADAVCQVTYMIEGKDAVTVSKTVPANSRRSFNMADDIGSADASIKVTSNRMVIPERAMYKNNRREGHDSIGTTTSGSYYYLAEGTTAWGFTTYVLVQNPNTSAIDVSLTYMTPQGEFPQAPVNIPAQSRKTFRVNDVLPNADVSTEIHGTGPIIAERSMYWDNGTGEAMHDSIGLAESHRSFYLPDGDTSGGAQTWVLVQNPNAEAIDIVVSYLKPDGTTEGLTDNVPANSRKTYNMADKVPSGRAAIQVSSSVGWRFNVERAMYWSNRGAGADTIGSYSD